MEAAGAQEVLPADVPLERVVGVFTTAPTGGYSLKVLGVEEGEDALSVRVKLEAPEGPAIQVITHPWVLLLLEKAPDKPLKLRVER